MTYPWLPLSTWVTQTPGTNRFNPCARHSNCCATKPLKPRSIGWNFSASPSSCARAAQVASSVESWWGLCALRIRYCDAGMSFNDKRGRRCSSGFKYSILRLFRHVASSTIRRNPAGVCRDMSANTVAEGRHSETPCDDAGYKRTFVFSIGVMASRSNTSPVTMRLFGRLKCNSRALPLALLTSCGCCRIRTSTTCGTGVTHWQMHALCGRRQRAQLQRLAIDTVCPGFCGGAIG